MNSRLVILLVYLAILVLIYIFSKGYIVVLLLGSMMATMMMSGPLASLAYGISKGKNNESIFYALMTFSVNFIMSCIVVAVEDLDLSQAEKVAMLILMIVVSLIASASGYYYFERIFDYKSK